MVENWCKWYLHITGYVQLEKIKIKKGEGKTVIPFYLKVQNGIILFELVLLFCLGKLKIAAAAFPPPPAPFTLMRGQIYLLVHLCTKIY